MKRILLLAAVLLSVFSVTMKAQNDKDHNFTVSKNIEVFSDIYRYLDMIYVDTLNADEVIGNGINAMLNSLDPYTEYYPESEVNKLKKMFTGRYVGIGAMIRYNTALSRVVIDEPYEGSPAAEAGLKKGDIILSIDDTTMTDKTVAFVSSHLRGDPGTSFMLKIKRPSTGKKMQMRIRRRAITLPYLPYYGVRPDGIGYINLNSFTDGCAKDVRRAFIDLKHKGAKGLVLDLRGNGGGSVKEAVQIVNMFVPKDLTIVRTRGKMKRMNTDYKTTVEPIDTVMPIVVLVNGETASASEITSGALQDLDRAVVLGTRTYGKGLVQAPVDLPYNGQLKLTTGKYYIPSNRCIQAINYKHAHGGYTEHVADSLTHVFYTKAGREVRDGGGIKPDVEVKPDSLPNIAYYLSVSGLDSTEVMLNYEIDYIAKHPTIAPAGEFKLTDQEYEDFKQQVIKSGFKYDAESSKELDKLKKIAKFEGYYDDAKEEFDALEKKFRHNLATDLDRNKQLINQIISADIVAAYYFQAGAIENNLNYDKQMMEACRIINDRQEYTKILTPAPKQDAKDKKQEKKDKKQSAKDNR